MCIQNNYSNNSAFDELENYMKLNTLGKGSFAKVFSAKNKDGQIFAVKKIKMISPEQEGITYSILREIAALKMLKHQNIIRLEEIQKKSHEMYIILEYAQGSLAAFIETYGGLNLSIFQIQNIMSQVLCGVDYMHNRFICHRDLKPENILISQEGLIKITDFGLSRYMNPITSQLLTRGVATQVYRAPELLLDFASYTNSVDIWSVGCIFAELILQTPLFVAQTPLQTLIMIFSLLGKPTIEGWPELSENSIFMALEKDPTPVIIKQPFVEVKERIGHLGIDLLLKMLTINPKKRITANEALKHPFFAAMLQQF